MSPAFLFDLDMTLLDTSKLQRFRDRRHWSYVKEHLHLAQPFVLEGELPPHEIPSKLNALGLPVAVITSSPRWYAETLLQIFEIDYDVLVAYEDTVNHKPDPEPLNYAIQQLGNPDQVFYVGDTRDDTQASYWAEIKSIGAGWGIQNFNEIYRNAPDILLAKPGDLLNPQLERYGYLAEMYSDNTSPIIHPGVIIQWTDNAIGQCVALGRYFPTGDPRHIASALSENILQLKSNDTVAGIFANSLATLINALPKKHIEKEYLIVNVPPKPGQENRFAEILSLIQESIRLEIVMDGLETIENVTGYKYLSPDEREDVINGVFQSNYDWGGSNIILIDDVYTSGATVKECVRVLKDNGAKSVLPIVFAIDQEIIERKICTSCGRPMRIRTRKRDGHKFWGCAGYPNTCKHTEDI